MSSGCFRLVNDDVIDLYDRVPVGTKVVVGKRRQSDGTSHAIRRVPPACRIRGDRRLCAGAAGGGADAAAVKERGTLVCGVSQGLAGFSAANDKGEWSGFDADFCRAVAAAVLGDASKVKFVPLSASERFDALKSGGIDLLRAKHHLDDGPRNPVGTALRRHHLL